MRLQRFTKVFQYLLKFQDFVYIDQMWDQFEDVYKN